uniref:Uncharacterized protein n=1 Tax=Rhodopseudomonas palustris (strain DX-1) TaxID=652103 RepID=E6VFK6_RHOPX
MTAIIPFCADWLRNLKYRFHRRCVAPLMATCRVCGKSDEVAMYDPRGLWAYFVRRTWCPEHCPDHDYVYSPWDGHYCDNCGKEPEPEWFWDRD